MEINGMTEQHTAGDDFRWNPQNVTDVTWSLSADDSRGLKNFITTNCNHTHTHTVFLGLPGWAGARRKLLLDCMVQGKITEADTPTIRLGAIPSGLISDPPPSYPHFHAGSPSCCNPPNLPWLGTGTKYVGLHIQWLGWHKIQYNTILVLRVQISPWKRCLYALAHKVSKWSIFTIFLLWDSTIICNKVTT